MALAILANKLGPRSLIELMKLGKLKFRLWTEDIFAFSEESHAGTPAVYPVMSGPFSPECYSEPEASARGGLRWATRPMSRQEQRRLVRTAAKNTSPHPKNISHLTVETIKAAHVSGQLTAHGLKPETHYSEFTYDQVKTLRSLASAELEFASVATIGAGYFLVGENNSTYPNHPPTDTVRSILELERLPDFRTLMLSGALPLEEVPEIVGRPETRDF